MIFNYILFSFKRKRQIGLVNSVNDNPFDEIDSFKANLFTDKP